MKPALPFMEVHTRPPVTEDPAEPVVTLSKDANGRWWHTVKTEVVRPATIVESLLMMQPSTWKRLGTPAAEPQEPA